MKIFKFLTREAKETRDDTPTISSLKSEELWQFIQRPEGVENAESRAADLADIWAKAQYAASNATLGKDKSSEDWALNSQ